MLKRIQNFEEKRGFMLNQSNATILVSKFNKFRKKTNVTKQFKK
jgi:hypothetical protein